MFCLCHLESAMMLNFPIPENIKHLKTKKVYIGCFGFCHVLQYISRIDSNGTHGWQCRFLKPSTFFNDLNYGGILEALEEAILFLSSIYKPRAIKIITKENKNKKIPIGIRGIGILKTKKKNRHTEELYVEIYGMKRGQSNKRIYVGTRNTATTEKMEAAIKKALKMKNKMQLESLFL